MVAKLNNLQFWIEKSLNLAKIHMVAKLLRPISNSLQRLNLAKIHMVAKRL